MSWTYVSLGDSLSIDDYTGVDEGGAASLLHRNIDDVYPDFEGKDLASTFSDCKHIALATNGTSLENILRDQVSELPSKANLVTLTAGGEKLLRTIERFAPGFVEKELIDAAADNVVMRWEAIVAGIRKKLPSVPIFATNIFDPTDGKGKANGWITWERLPKYIQGVNERIAAHAATHKVELIDIGKAFRNHGLTVASDKQWLGGVVEVNARGANEIRSLWWQRLTQLKLV